MHYSRFGSVLIFPRPRDPFLRGRFGCVHDPADIGQASAALRIFDAAVTAAETLGGLNLFHDQRAAVSYIILANVISRVLETIADQILHEAFSLEPSQLITGPCSSCPILPV